MEQVPSSFWLNTLTAHSEVIAAVAADHGLIENLQSVSSLLIKCFKDKRRLLVCGNGGSAADAQHLVAELVGRFYKERPALDAEALTVNSSCLTAIGNDYGYDESFARQVEAKARTGDVLWAISTSGNSKNVVRACIKAKECGAFTIGMTGANQESWLAKNTDYCLLAPIRETPRIQEAHILFGHMICEYVESSLF